MDEVDNAINEALREGVPAAPHPSPEKTKGNPETHASNKVKILRFLVTKIDSNTVADNKFGTSMVENEDTKDSCLRSDSGPGFRIPNSAHTIPTTTAAATTTTTTIIYQGASPKPPEDGAKEVKVAGRQTEGSHHLVKGKISPTLTLLEGTVRELKNFAVFSPNKRMGSTHVNLISELQERKRFVSCLSLLAVVMLLLGCTCMLAFFYSYNAISAANTTLHANHTLPRSKQHKLQEERTLYEEGFKAEVSYGDSQTAEIDHLAEVFNTTAAEAMEQEDIDGEVVGLEGSITGINRLKEDSSQNTTEIEALEEDNDPNTSDIEEEEKGHYANTTEIEDLEDEQDEELLESDAESEVSGEENIRTHLDGQAGDKHKYVELKPRILRVIHLKAQSCVEGGDVVLHRYVSLYYHLLQFFRNFGTFASVLGKMLDTRLVALSRYIRSEDRQHYKTLTSMVQFEDRSETIGNIHPFSGTTLFTCLHRHLQFMSLCLSNVLASPNDSSLFHSFRSAYQEVLAVNHAWFVEHFYLTGMSMLPTKQEALKLSLAQINRMENATLREVHDSISTVVLDLNSLAEISEAILQDSNALNKIPKQVIT